MDDVDFSTLAARMTAGLDGVRACLILSSDGLTLGVYPESGEARAREAWDRLQDLGDPQRGFVDIGEELWVFVRGGPYAGMLLTGPGVRPGLLIDKLEFLLRAAEEARARETTELSAMPARPEATRRPRTALHGDAKPAPAPAPRAAAAPSPPAATPRPPAPAPARASAERSPAYQAPPVLSGAAKKVVDVTAELAKPADVPEALEEPPTLKVGPGPESLSEVARQVEKLSGPEAPEPVPAAAPPAPETVPSPKRVRKATRAADRSPAPAAAATPAPAPAPAAASDAEVDRVALAREFGRLLAEGGAGGDR